MESYSEGSRFKLWIFLDRSTSAYYVGVENNVYRNEVMRVFTNELNMMEFCMVTCTIFTLEEKGNCLETLWPPNQGIND